MPGPKQPRHYSIRLTAVNNTARLATEQRFGANTNFTLNVAIALGLEVLSCPWKAPYLKRARQRAFDTLTFEGNARKFRDTLTPHRGTK